MMIEKFVLENFRRQRQRSTVTVLMGGVSGEHAVSLDSGKAVGAALQQAGYRVTLFEVTDNVSALVAALTRVRPDVVFNALHGTYGEDGAIQGLLDMLQLPYTHSGRLASCLAMNKAVARTLFTAAGLPIAAGRVILRDEFNRMVKQGHDPMPRPFILKPLAEGSSLGVKLVKPGDQLSPLDQAQDQNLYGEALLVEEFIPGRELTVGVIGHDEGAASMGMIEINYPEGLFDYEAKYSAGIAEHIIPPNLPANLLANIEEVAVKAHRALGCRGISRADFRFETRPTAAARLALLEINTQPGMTDLSLVPDLARAKGFSFAELVTYLVEEAKWG
ncbi:MAG: D-alanine--D-alanine ligase [Candidatus Symbiobacter sp.]|nr:D-alanine--D-alanine ligase [Candidatus Symbiobacter sp.]